MFKVVDLADLRERLNPVTLGYDAGQRGSPPTDAGHDPNEQQIPKRLVLISDLMQHSEHLSVYGQLPDYDIFNRTSGADALRTNLQDVRVEVFFVQRREHERFDGTLRLIGFWERWIDGQQGQLARVEKI